MDAVRSIMLFLHIGVSVLLIVLVAVMQQKHEGISGIMGGTQTTRGIKGMDEGMRRFITYVGVSFFLSCIIFSLLSR